MDVVYVFNENNTVRIPVFGYDQQLCGLLVSNGGVWDKAGHQYIIDNTINVNKLLKSLIAKPVVWVEEKAQIPVRILNFCNFPDTDHPFEITELFRLDGSPSPSEKFTKYWQTRLDTELRSRKYSYRTLQAYLYYNHLLCRTAGKFPDEIKKEDITRFLSILEKDKEYSASSMNLAISAVKFFHREIMKNDIVSEQYRPRHDKRFPMVLSKTEVNKILALETNPKHRLLLTLVYSSGLRVSEVVVLKKEHLDIARGVICIKQGKGRKDRYTMLSEKAAGLLSEYYSIYNIKTWLFPGQEASKHLTIRSAQSIFVKALHKAGIEKNISIHSFRHTFATHLIENGTDIRYIQFLLGHSSIRTTERYTHIAKGSILNIKSPLDT